MKHPLINSKKLRIIELVQPSFFSISQYVNEDPVPPNSTSCWRHRRPCRRAKLLSQYYDFTVVYWPSIVDLDSWYFLVAYFSH